MGCCNNENNPNNNNHPEDVDPCCSIQGRRCFCLPYDDALMITSLVLSIVAVFVSWIWWVTLIISLIGMTMIQVLWCCRQSKATVLGSAAAAFLCALAQVGIGIYILVVWSRAGYCEPFFFWADDDNYYRDYCEEKTWATIAFVCAALWLTVFGCIVRFVASGRHAKWEEKHSGGANNNNNNNNNRETASEAVELGRLPPALPVPAAEPAVSVAIPLAESKEIES